MVVRCVEVQAETDESWRLLLKIKVMTSVARQVVRLEVVSKVAASLRHGSLRGRTYQSEIWKGIRQEAGRDDEEVDGTRIV